MTVRRRSSRPSSSRALSGGLSPQPLPVRARAWLWCGCAAALVATYLVLWTLYGMTHLPAFPRYQQVAAGASASTLGADFTLESLVMTRELTSVSGEPQIASGGAVWVVATLKVVRRADDPEFLCRTELLGPDGRASEPASVRVERELSGSCNREALPVDQPYRFEEVFEIPQRDADRLYGVAVLNQVESTPELVLTPAG